MKFISNDINYVYNNSGGYWYDEYMRWHRLKGPAAQDFFGNKGWYEHGRRVKIVYYLSK
jgi:hypothetical protein